MNNLKDEVVDKVLSGKADRTEAKHVALWLATEDGQAYLSARMDAEFFQEEKEENWVSDEDQKRMFCSLQRQITRKRFSKLLLKVVAIATPVAAVITLLFYLNTQVPIFESPSYQDIYVPKGERMQIAFQDGTRVYLYPGSHLRYPDKFELTNRTVMLEGEAYFEVSKNPQRPFMVEVDEVAVKVTGTSFYVQAYRHKSDIIVSLDEGKVDLLYGDRQEFSLKPGEALIYSKEKNSCMLQLLDGENKLMNWKEQDIRFQNIPMRDVLEELDLHYGIPFCVEDTAVYEHSYTLYMKKPSLEEVIETLEVISPVRFQKGDTIKVCMKQH